MWVLVDSVEEVVTKRPLTGEIFKDDRGISIPIEGLLEPLLRPTVVRGLPSDQDKVKDETLDLRLKCFSYRISIPRILLKEISGLLEVKLWKLLQGLKDQVFSPIFFPNLLHSL